MAEPTPGPWFPAQSADDGITWVETGNNEQGFDPLADILIPAGMTIYRIILPGAVHLSITERDMLQRAIARAKGAQP